jgi:glucosyl-dolichyl phosphate glucuronosyltransferase
MVDISIIIPTLNRAAVLSRTLESLANCLTSDASVEIIMVDNGSTDRTRDAFDAIRTKFPDRDWRYFYEPIPGVLSGRHKGATEARGEILCFLDDDVLLAPTWFEAVQEAFVDLNLALMGGPSRPTYEAEPPDWLDAVWSITDGGRMLESLSLLDLGSMAKPIDAKFVWGLNFCIRKSVFHDCGGFHPDCVPKALQRYQGDGETGLAKKITENGLRSFYHPGAAVAHVIPASRLRLEAFEQRAFYQGVCDSFTQIRRTGSIPDRRSWKDWIRPVKRRLERDVFRLNSSAERLRRVMCRSHYDGMRFHANQVRRDPSLFQWVVKPNYLDYRLPTGWEDYWQRAAA